MIVKETVDINEIKSILCHPAIYECISDDNCMPSSEFEPPIAAQYIAGYVDNEIIGLMVYHDTEQGLKCHVQVLPEYRKRYAKEFAQIAFTIGKAKNAIILSEIPTCYPNVIKFAKELGFKEIGRIINKHVKYGVKFDVIKFRKDIWDSSQTHSTR